MSRIARRQRNDNPCIPPRPGGRRGRYIARAHASDGFGCAGDVRQSGRSIACCTCGRALQLWPALGALICIPSEWRVEDVRAWKARMAAKDAENPRNPSNENALCEKRGVSPEN